MLKTKVELVTGFIGAGKTTWVSRFIQETAVRYEKIVVMQLENGQESLTLSAKQGAELTHLTEVGDTLTWSYLNNLLILYEPDRLIIECNGMKELEDIMTLFEHPKVKKKAFVSTVFNLVEAPSFKVYWHNLQPVLGPALRTSHMIIVTKSHLIDAAEKGDLQRLLEKENAYAHILFTEDIEHMGNIMRNCTLLDKGWLKVISVQFKSQLKKMQRDREDRR